MGKGKAHWAHIHITRIWNKGGVHLCSTQRGAHYAESKWHMLGEGTDGPKVGGDSEGDATQI